MRKFLLGILTGLILTVLSVIVLVFSAARFGENRPTISDNATLVLNLRGDVPEKATLSFPVPIPFLSSSPSLTVQEIWMALHRASTDNRVKAIVLNVGRVDAGWGKMNELREDILAFRKSGKPVYAFLRSPRLREYYLATAADRIYANPEDLFDLKGMRAEIMFFKNALDKVGVQIEVAHVGKYKDAGDMFTETAITPETRESLGLLLDGIYGSTVEAIATARKKTPEEIRAIFDDGPYTSKQAMKAGLLDALRYEDQAYGELKTQLKQQELKKVDFRNYVRSLTPDTGKKRVAFVVGSGTMLRGSGDDAMGTDEGFTSQAFIKMLHTVAQDSSISGVILRVDSPGGDAFATDEMLREVRLLREKKPMVISFSDYAASGGYYVAMTGDPIVAYPNTVTGSIGVVFSKPNLRGLYDKLGIQKDYILRGKNAAIDTDYGPMTPDARVKLQVGLEELYTQFVTAVSEGRKRKYDEMEPLAQGRVWLGSDAKQKGLVDELGGLDTAVAAIRKKVGLQENEAVRLVPYPPKRTLLEQLLKSSSETSTVESQLSKATGIDLRLFTDSRYLHWLPFQLRMN
ncbi:MAG: signal peptide peptidase SppA [Bryobacteraceae bacterium]|nr:signal peptide peptidase SppA [Bryobacteraceae bacterium]